MPFNKKHKSWLSRHLGINTGDGNQKAEKEIIIDYGPFETKKDELNGLAKQLGEYDFAKNRSKRLRNELQAADVQLRRQDKASFENALKESLKELASLKSRTTSDLKNAKLLESRMEAVRSNGRLIMTSPVPHPETAEIIGALRSATMTAQNGDIAQAYKDLAGSEQTSKSLAKSAPAEIADKKKWDERKADAETCIGILNVVPKADPKKVQDELDKAQKLADKGQFKAAYDDLKNYKKLYDAEAKLAEGKQQADIDNSAKADLVIERLEALDLLLVQVAVLPGLTAWIEEQKKALDLVRPKENQYAAAWKTLEKSWNPAKIKSAAEKESASQSKKALKNDTIQKLYNNVKGDLEALQDLATDEVLTEYRKGLARGMDIYISATNSSKSKSDTVEKALVEATAKITRLNSDIDKDLRNLASTKKKCDDQRTAIENGLKMLTAVVTTEARSRIGLEWERLSAALGVKEFENSLPKLEQLHKDIDNLLTQNTKDTQQWERKLTELTADIPDKLDKVAACPVTGSSAADLRAEWDDIKRLGSRREPGEALAAAPGLVALIDAQMVLVKQYDDLAKARKAANTKVQSEFKMAAGEIEKLKNAVTKKRTSDPSGTPAVIGFEADLKLLTTQWNGDMKGAYKNATELEKKAADIISSIAEMLKAVEAAASDDNAIGEIAATQEHDEKRLVYLGKAEEVRLKLENLAEMDSRMSIKLEKRLAAYDKNASVDYDKAIAGADKLFKEAGEAITQAEDRHKNTLESVRLIAEATLKKVDETEKGLGKKKAGFKDFFANLRSLIDDMKNSMMESTSIAVLMSANHEFNEILRPMYQVVDDASKGGKDKLDYSSVLKTVETQSKFLNSNANLESCQPTMKNLLLEKFGGIQTSIKVQSPREATATLAEFQKELDDIKVKADSAMAMRTTFKLNAKTAKAKLKKLDQKFDYTRSLESKLKGLEGTTVVENKEETATRDLVLLLVEIDRALNDPEYANEQEMEVRKAALETEQKRKEWEANLKAFESVMAEVNKAMKKAGDDADLSQVRELESMRKESKSIAKGGDYVTALQKLDLTRKHAQKVIKNPVGETVTSRNNLPKDLTNYQAAIKGFNKHMSTLAAMVKSEGDNADKSAVNAAIKMLKSMQFEFDIKVFDKSVGLLSNKKADTGAKRAAREQVLSTVRSYQTRLDKGPLMLKVLLAPFKPDARSAFDGVRISLNSLDVNVRRCV